MTAKNPPGRLQAPKQALHKQYKHMKNPDMEIPSLSFPEEEASVLKECYKKASSILEYGSGGSTWYAAIHSGKKIVTVESNYEFGNALLRKINAAGLPSIPNIIYEDIGPVGKWGRPIDPSHWNKFIHYALAPWERFPDLEPDVVLIDGRFRTACFATTALSIKKPTRILFDDYAGRPHYHKVEFLARPEKIIGRLAIFSLTPQQFSNKKIKEIFSLLFNAPAITVHEELKTNMGLLSKETNQLVKENAELKKRLKDIEERLGKTLTEYKSSQKIQAELKGDLRRARKKYRKLKRWGLVLSMPSLIALSPVSIPVGIFYSIKQWRRRLKKKNKPVSNALLAPKVSEAASAPKHLVFEAFLLHQNSSPTAALALLDKHKANVPPGTRALFESMNAKTDSDWLDAINRWASARGLPEILLESGTKPRFHRIAFPACKEVQAPHLVTVIMPCYNAEETVERSVRSILEQSWKNIELIAVNDASTDATGSILDEIAKSEPRLKVLHNRINVGPYVSKNLALMQAKGKYVTGHDADDIALPERISRQMAPILEDLGCKATIGHMIRLDEQGYGAYLSKIGRSSYDGVLRRASISLLIDRNILIKEIGFWDSVRFGADSEMINRINKKLGSNIKIIEDTLMLCLSSESSLTGHPQHGISQVKGVSPIRKTYMNSWKVWHQKVGIYDLTLPFPHTERQFEAPNKMLVPEADVRCLLASITVENKNQVKGSENTRPNWSLKGNFLIFNHLGRDFYWEMPSDFTMPSNALLSLAEYLLLSPYGIEVNVEEGIKKNNGRVALAFSGGVDSSAALRLLPDPIPIYTQVAAPKGKHNIENALLALQAVNGKSIMSNWDELPLLYGKKPGTYSKGGSWTVTSVLLSDYLNVTYVADGNILDFVYLEGPKGHGTIYNRGNPKDALRVFRQAGLEYCVPCAGLTEVVTMKIAENAAYAMGCMQGSGGTPCMDCMKCYRKEALKNNPIPSCRESETILYREIIPVLGTLMWAYHNCGLDHPRLRQYSHKDISWVDKWYPKSIEYIPQELRKHFLDKLNEYGIKHLTDVTTLERWDAR